MPRLHITDLLESSLVDPVAHLDAGRVEHYARNLDALAPVVVFETEDGLLLADGYHRLAAAQRAGAETIDAELRRGSRQDALGYAAAIGATQRGITAEAAQAAIRRHSQTGRGESN